MVLVASFAMVAALFGSATIAFATGHLLGGPDPHHSMVLALSTACRHPAIALTIAAANFPAERFGGAILLYALVAFITATPYIAWQRRQMRTAPTPAVGRGV